SIATGSNTAWLWNVGDGSPVSNLEDPVHCYINDSVYSPVSFNVTLTVTSDSGCVTTLSKTNYITVYPNPNADFTVQPEVTTITDPIISITDLSTGVYYWNWNFGDGSASITAGLDTSTVFGPADHTYQDTSTYTITLIASTQYNCIDTAYQTIIIEPDFMFYIPNAFTPNDDGINDFFSGKGTFVGIYEMAIFDRWGNLIFNSDDIAKPWDGKANKGATIAQGDVYIYSIKITDFKKRKYTYKGIVTLVR
ncbi:MAG: gliding motility-associated C-terminal domain-containing protein, partial [Bacteroidota bacterium]|nr:gliding motility-associated C-terminal domain-containing protein [Bacteroidota bacterium]